MNRFRLEIRRRRPRTMHYLELAVVVMIIYCFVYWSVEQKTLRISADVLDEVARFTDEETILNQQHLNEQQLNALVQSEDSAAEGEESTTEERPTVNDPKFYDQNMVDIYKKLGLDIGDPEAPKEIHFVI